MVTCHISLIHKIPKCDNKAHVGIPNTELRAYSSIVMRAYKKLKIPKAVLAKTK